MWWGSAPTPQAQALTRKVHREEGGLGRGVAPFPPCPPGPRGRPAPRARNIPLTGKQGHARPWPERGLPYPLALFQIGRARGQWAAAGCPLAPRQGRGAVGSPPLARPPPRGTGCPRPRRGGGGQGGLSTAGASATPPPLRPASQAGSESVSLRSQTHLRSLEGSKKKPNDFNDLGGGVCSPWMSRGLLTLDEQGCNVCCRSANISSS